MESVALFRARPAVIAAFGCFVARFVLVAACYPSISSPLLLPAFASLVPAAVVAFRRVSVVLVVSPVLLVAFPALVSAFPAVAVPVVGWEVAVF